MQESLDRFSLQTVVTAYRVLKGMIPYPKAGIDAPLIFRAHQIFFVGDTLKVRSLSTLFCINWAFGSLMRKEYLEWNPLINSSHLQKSQIGCPFGKTF